jgi:phytanoyl-CoA hydroxylase
MRVNSELKERYDVDGYCSISSFLSAEDVRALRSYVDLYIDTFAPRLSGRNVNWLDKENKLVNSIHKTDLDPGSPITQLLKSSQVTDIVSGLLGEKAVPRVAEIFFKPAKAGMKSPMHQDNYYWCLKPANALTVWLSLTGADEGNGGISYHAESHKLGLLDHTDSFAPGSSQMVPESLLPSEEKKVTPSLEAGDALFHHSLTIHGSAPNLSERDRVGITLQYQAESCELDLEQQKIYLSSLKDQVAAREELI